jgi:hypothetical protein
LKRYHKNQGNVGEKPRKDSRECFKHLTRLKKTGGNTKGKGNLMDTSKDRQMSKKLMGKPRGVPKDLSRRY